MTLLTTFNDGCMGEVKMDDMAYVAKCKCGGLVMAVVDLPEHKKDTVKEVASCLRVGYEIERISVEAAKTAKWCDNHGKCISLKEQRAGQLALWDK